MSSQSETEQRRRRTLLEMQEHPNNCFCSELTGRWPERSDNDELVGYINFVPPSLIADFRYEVRKCVRCGKQYMDNPTWARGWINE